MLHGGEIYQNPKIQYDFSVNINPLGVPGIVKKRLLEMISAEVSGLEQYPDQDSTALRAALADHTGLPAEKILCGNGASELIEAAVRAIRPERVLLTAPSFSGYLHAAEGIGARILWHFLRREEDFRLTERYLEDLENLKDPNNLNDPENLKDPEKRPQMAILCNPANPVGNLIDPGLLSRIVETCERLGIWLMIDECFLGFLEEEEAMTARRYLREREGGTLPAPAGSRPGPGRLLVLDAFTKLFAMPGIRLGYLMAQEAELIRKIHAQQPEWSVSVPAQTAGLAALEASSDSYLRESRALVASERGKMEAALRQMGFHVYPGQANFLFFSVGDAFPGDGPDLQALLLEKGILIRSCDNYPGLRKGDYRTAVLSPERNAVLLQALADLV